MSLGALSVGGRAGSSLKLWWFGQRRTELPGQLQSACAGAEIPRRPTLIVAVAMTMAILRAIFILFTSGLTFGPHGWPGTSSVGDDENRRNQTVPHLSALQDPAS